MTADPSRKVDECKALPVRTGYMYSGHWYIPLPPFFLPSVGLKCTMGICTSSSMGSGSVRHPFSKSHPAPSR